ncbi:hypothetical protein ACWGII_35845 [Streptomyces sp. NPDC054855]
MKNNIKRFGTVAGVFLGVTMIATTNAYATWESELAGVRPNFASREWADESYTQIHFKRCFASDGNHVFNSVTVELIRMTGTNTSFGSKTFTECFSRGDGDETSTGVWTGLPSGDYRFKIKEIGGSDSQYRLMRAEKVIVDTTKAD